MNRIYAIRRVRKGLWETVCHSGRASAWGLARSREEAIADLVKHDRERFGGTLDPKNIEVVKGR